jgi:hypothetical protein
MDWNVIAGVLRAVLPAAFAYAVGAGWLPVGDYSAVTAGIVGLGAAVWSIKSNVPAKQ